MSLITDVLSDQLPNTTSGLPMKSHFFQALSNSFLCFWCQFA